jgi:hypothetical protein
LNKNLHQEKNISFKKNSTDLKQEKISEKDDVFDEMSPQELLKYRTKNITELYLDGMSDKKILKILSEQYFDDCDIQEISSITKDLKKKELNNFQPPQRKLLSTHTYSLSIFQPKPAEEKDDLFLDLQKQLNDLKNREIEAENREKMLVQRFEDMFKQKTEQQDKFIADTLAQDRKNTMIGNFNFNQNIEPVKQEQPKKIKKDPPLRKTAKQILYQRRHNPVFKKLEKGDEIYIPSDDEPFKAEPLIPLNNSKSLKQIQRIERPLFQQLEQDDEMSLSDEKSFKNEKKTNQKNKYQEILEESESEITYEKNVSKEDNVKVSKEKVSKEKTEKEKQQQKSKFLTQKKFDRIVLKIKEGLSHEEIIKNEEISPPSFLAIKQVSSSYFLEECITLSEEDNIIKLLNEHRIEKAQLIELKFRKNYLNFILRHIAPGKIQACYKQIGGIFHKPPRVIAMYHNYMFDINNSKNNQEIVDHYQCENNLAIDEELSLNQDVRAYTPEEIKKIELVNELKDLEHQQPIKRAEEMKKIAERSKLPIETIRVIRNLSSDDFCKDSISKEKKEKLKQDVKYYLIEKQMNHFQKELSDKINLCKTKKDIIDFLLTFNVPGRKIAERVSVVQSQIVQYDNYIFFQSNKKEDLSLFRECGNGLGLKEIIVCKKKRNERIIELSGLKTSTKEIKIILKNEKLGDINISTIHRVIVKYNKEHGTEVTTKKVKTS